MNSDKGRKLISSVKERGVKSALRERYPGAAQRYKRFIRPYIGPKHRFAKLDDWATTGHTLRGEYGAVAITVDAEGVWLHDNQGLQYLYLEGPQTMLGLKTGEEFEGAEIALLTSALPPGGVLIDVGANIGRLTIEAAIAVDGLRVLAVEPVEHTYTALAANITRNGLASRVIVRRLALSDHVGRGVMTSDLGSANHLVSDNQVPGHEQIEITTLDSLLAQQGLDRVDVIKCDVEGAELLVLMGATRTLDTFRPAILVEIEQRWATRYERNATELFDYLSARGYGYERIRGGKVEPHGSSVMEDLAVANNFWFTAHDPSERLRAGTMGPSV